PASVASSASSHCSNQSSGSRKDCTSAPSPTSTTRRWCAASWPTATSVRARWRRKPCVTCARPWASTTVEFRLERDGRAGGAMNMPLELAPVVAAVPLDMLALICGEPLLELPKNLYIPPDALQVMLEAFERTLDLLLY